MSLSNGEKDQIGHIAKLGIRLERAEHPRMRLHVSL